MKITIGPLSFDILLFLRLCLPTTVFIGLCTAIFVAFNPVLLLIDQIAPPSEPYLFIGIAWLLLLILYIILGIAFTRFSARLLRRSFGSEALRVQKRMATLSGFPFYALSLLGLIATINCFLFPNNVTGLAAFVSELGFVGFALVSFSYFLLLRFLLSRSTPMAHQLR